LGTLVGDGEPSLLSTADIATLESIEEGILAPNDSIAFSTEEWYQTLTRLLTEIHSRIAVNLVEDVRLPPHYLPTLDSITKEHLESGQAPVRARSSCGCRAGLKALLQSLVDKL